MKNPHCVGNWNPKKCVWQPTFKKFEKWLKDSTTDIHQVGFSALKTKSMSIVVSKVF